MSERRLPAEWEPQDAILLTWPHRGTDWDLDEVIPLYEALAAVIAPYADLVIAAPETDLESVRRRLDAMSVPSEALHLYGVAGDDTWARDHGPIIVREKTGQPGFTLLDFEFNGWGKKHPFALDNLITSALYRQGAFPGAAHEPQDWILEGGAIDVDGKGTLLTTRRCLLNPNRNPELTQAAIEARLKMALGVKKINWLAHGHLAGDDTDGHVDMLARLCPDNTILYTQCDDPDDEHYEDLQNLESELEAMTDCDGQPYRLIALPWPGPVEDDEGRRLPASYANFLIVNGAVVVPQYGMIADDEALAQVSQAFPGYDILGLPCNALIEQGGSLHCITMQIPEGVLFEHESS